MIELDKFLALKSKKSLVTGKAYRSSVERFLKELNINTLEEIDNLTAMDYLDYQNKLSNSGLSNSSVNSHFRNISSFVAWLKKYKLIKNIPTIRDVDKLKVERNPIFYFTEDEEEAMLATTKNIGKKLMILLMLEIGIRRAEVSNIKVADIHGDQLLVHREKSHKNQEIPLTPDAVSLIEKYLKQRTFNSEYLFYGSKKGRLSPECVGLRIKGAAKRAGISEERLKHVSAHATRKTCASRLINNGVPLEVIQDILGHEHIETTRRYYASTDIKSIKKAILSQKSLIGEHND